MEIKAPKDFWAGLMFIAIGLGFAYAAQEYPMGTAVRMGPAFFPTVLGGLLALLGLVLLGKSTAITGEGVPQFHFRPLAIILLALVLFGLLLRPFGIAAAIISLVVVAVLAAGRMKVQKVLLLAVGLAFFSVLVFHYGLGLPFKIWPWQ